MHVGRINWILKETITKLAVETGTDWVVLLPYAMFRVQNSPYYLNFTPYEIMYGAHLHPPWSRDLLNQEYSLKDEGGWHRKPF